MKNIIALLIGLVNFSFAQNLPDWFYLPPNHQDYFFGVGISEKYAAQEDAYANARLDAVHYISHQVELKIISGLADVSSGSKGLAREYINEQVDPQLFNQISKNIVALDSIIINNEAFMLIVISKNLSPPNSNYYNYAYRESNQQKNTPTPKWIRQPPRKNGYIYGVGLGSRHKSTKSTWNNSAQNARLEIAQQKQSKIESLYLNRTLTYTQDIEWIEQKTNIILKNSRLIERWYDMRTDIYYTLVEHQIR